MNSELGSAAPAPPHRHCQDAHALVELLIGHSQSDAVTPKFEPRVTL